MPPVIKREQAVEQFAAGGVGDSVAHALQGVVKIPSPLAAARQVRWVSLCIVHHTTLREIHCPTRI
ncbi:MAG: hypothetical protein U1F76_29285 [Candidatus Competibacteraceae bacterium]